MEGRLVHLSSPGRGCVQNSRRTPAGWLPPRKEKRTRYTQVDLVPHHPFLPFPVAPEPLVLFPCCDLRPPSLSDIPSAEGHPMQRGPFSG